MTDYTSQITALYEAIEFRAPPAADIAAFNAELNAGNYTPAQVTSLITSQIESSSYVQNFVNPVIRMYEAALGRVPDQAGLSYWVNQVATNPNALNNLATIFANSQEFMLDYGATQGASTPNNPALVYALYKNILGRTPDQAGLTYWENSGLDAAQLLAAFISPNDTEYVTDTTPFVTQFENLEATGMEPTTGSLFNIPIPGGVTTYTIELGQSAIDYTITGTLGGQTITGVLTSGSGLAPITGTSNVVINAPYGLNDFQSIMLTGSNNVLNANYGPGANFSQTGLNIQGVQTWNIQTAGPAIAGYSGLAAGETPAVISFTGDAAQGNLISGLTTVNFNDNSSDNTLLIGDNSEPVQEPNGANGFAINVSNAVGYYNPTTDVINGVDVDIAAQAFTGKDTINISANIVGGFGELNGSYVIPALELSAPNDGDDYNPNWLGFEENAFSISAGASSGPNGAIGFQNWVVSSTGAKSVGSMNILALGGEGSTTAQTLTVSDDGSPTMLFATAISDSLSSDWENLTTIDLTKTSGNIVLTGAEVDAAQGALTGVVGIGGLLTSDTTALVTIKGGTGNSFYDLSSLTAGAAVNPNALFQGGTSTKGNSEIAFNNSVLTAGAKVNIANIQVLDDTGGAPATGLSGLPLINGQGGTINMADFQTLGALNANYDLMSGPLGNLFYTNTHSAFSSAGSIYQDPTFAASTDVAPAGYQLLQLLDADGSTENVLTTGLTIADGFVQFAINMMDVADGSVTPAVRGSVYDNMFGNPVTATNHYSAAYTIGADPFANSQDPIAYGDAYFVADTNVYNLYSAPLETLTGQNIYIYQQDPTFNVNVQSHLKLWLADEGVNVYDHTGTLLLGSIFDAPQFTIDNYTTVDIYLPFESIGGQDWVVLGSQANPSAKGYVGFVDTPVVTVPLTTGLGFPPAIVGPLYAELNFYDNTLDTGGSPPGGADDLVLGFTNFTADLAPQSAQAFFDPTATIGYVSVAIDATAPTAIWDHGKGSLEIGATDASVLIAQSTSHLIMDAPGVPQYIAAPGGLLATQGIEAFGSLTGQNLMQGTLGVQHFDTNGAFLTGFDDGTFGVGGHVAAATTGLLTGTTGTLENVVPSQFGNDYLTGESATAKAGAVNLVGNTGDNYFPEGGQDTVALAADHGGNGVFDTVYVGMIDVSSTLTGTTVLPHDLFGQAVTDIIGGVESYTDGYGPGVGSVVGGAGVTGSATSLLTVTGFNEGNTATTGDVLVFDPQDWAVGPLANGIFDKGLVDAHTGLTIASSTAAHFASEVYVGTSASAGGTVTHSAELIQDGLNGYQNAAQLVKALTNANGGDIGGLDFGALTTEHFLLAYNNTVTGGVTIDDVTVTNTTTHDIFVTSTAGLVVTAVDMVNIVGTAANPVTVGNLSSHDVQFLHG